MDLERLFRFPVSLAAGGCDAGGGRELRRRYPFAARFGASCGAVRGDGAAVLAVGHCPSAALGCVDPGADRVRGGDEHL